jgi:hypothetical protein
MLAALDRSGSANSLTHDRNNIMGCRFSMPQLGSSHISVGT